MAANTDGTPDIGFPMADNAHTNAQPDEVVFSAQYCALKVWLSFIIMLIPVIGLLGVPAYFTIQEGRYLDAFCLLVIPAAMLLLALYVVVLNEMTFYRDRVAKVWSLFGQRTIYYSRASVKSPRSYDRALSSAHIIFESKDDGRPIRWRLPILYHSFFFPSEVAKQIDVILDYLTEDVIEENNPRKFRKFWLPKKIMQSPNLTQKARSQIG